jgi:hypothetical protein
MPGKPIRSTAVAHPVKTTDDVRHEQRLLSHSGVNDRCS